MTITDSLRFAVNALTGYRLRTVLMLVAMSIGVAAVVILTSLGEAARNYVTGQFASLGTNLVIVIPGRAETSGGTPGILVGKTPRDLTLDDARALLRNTSIRRIAPITVGSAPISWRQLDRDVVVIGSTAELLDVRHWEMEQGRFLPPGDIDRAAPVCVIGTKIRSEIFGNRNPLGEWIRISDRRFRVIGILGSEGRSIGVDVQDLVIIPVASAQSLYNNPSLFRILVEARSREDVPRAKQAVLRTLTERHQGEEDVTVITQDAVLSTFDRIFTALTLTVAGIAAISLAVAGILIMNVMLIAVSQRTAEIGLLKALGAKRAQIIRLFINEAATLALIGALLGLVIGKGVSVLLGQIYPALVFTAPWWAIGAALGVALVTGILFAIMPARRAAALDAVSALAKR
jgi:putative ABC transport system permease protein